MDEVAAGHQFTRRIRTYWHAALIAASVSLGSVRPEFDGPINPPHAIVHLIPDANEGISRRERVGNQILTQSLDLTDSQTGDRITDFLN